MLKKNNKLQNTQTLSGVTRITEFDINNELWKCYNDHDCFSLIRKSDGSDFYTNPSIWFKSWSDYEDYWLAKREDGLSTLINRYDFSQVFKNKWFLRWVPLENNLFQVTKKGDSFTIISKNGPSLYDMDLWFKLKKSYDDSKFEFTRDDGWKTLVNKSDYSLFSQDLWYFSLESFNEEFDLATRKDLSSTLVKKTDGKYLYQNAWYTKWEDFSDNLWRVTQNNNSKLLIDKLTGESIYKNMSINIFDWLEFNDLFLLVQRADGLYTLINKSDGTFALEEWERWFPKKAFFPIELGAIIEVGIEQFRIFKFN